MKVPVRQNYWPLRLEKNVSSAAPSSLETVQSETRDQICSASHHSNEAVNSNFQEDILSPQREEVAPWQRKGHVKA